MCLNNNYFFLRLTRLLGLDRLLGLELLLRVARLLGLELLLGVFLLLDRFGVDLFLSSNFCLSIHLPDFGFIT